MNFDLPFPEVHWQVSDLTTRQTRVLIAFNTKITHLGDARMQRCCYLGHKRSDGKRR